MVRLPDDVAFDALVAETCAGAANGVGDRLPAERHVLRRLDRAGAAGRGRACPRQLADGRRRNCRSRPASLARSRGRSARPARRARCRAASARAWTTPRRPSPRSASGCARVESWCSSSSPTARWLSPRLTCRLDGGRLAFERGSAAALRGAEVEFRLLAAALRVPRTGAAGPRRRVPRRRRALADRPPDAVAGERMRLRLERAEAARRRAASPSPSPRPSASRSPPSSTSPPIPSSSPAPATPPRRRSSILAQRAGASSRHRRWRFRAHRRAGAVARRPRRDARRRLHARRQPARSGRHADGEPRATARRAAAARTRAATIPAAQALDARKRAAPAAVVVLEALTQARFPTTPISRRCGSRATRSRSPASPPTPPR